MIKFKNVSKRMQVFSLPHEFVCEGACQCAKGEHRQRSHNPATGDVGERHIELTICSSVHLPAGHESEALPESVRNVPEIAAALRSGTLKESLA